MNPSLVIIDANSLIHRAYHALPPMNAPDGRATNAVYGFMGMLLRALADFKPAYLAVAFDAHGPTFRHRQYEPYKANRAAMPDDLRGQFPMIRALLDAMGVRAYELPGWEADDLLGTLSRRAGVASLLITGDRDALQLIAPQVSVALTRKGATELSVMDAAALDEFWGVAPHQVPDLKGLMGDASDNLPGVPKVGEKTAQKLLSQYHSLDAVLAAQGIPGKLGENLRAYADDARMCRDLARIDCDAPIGFALDDCRLEAIARPEALSLLSAYGMGSLVTRLQKLGIGSSAAPAATNTAPPPVATATHTATDIDALTALLAEQTGAPVALHLTEDALSVAFEAGDGSLACIEARLGGTLLEPGCALSEALAAMAPSMHDGMVLHDAKALWTKLGKPSPACGFDTLLAAYLADATRPSPTLAEATQAHLGEALPNALGVRRLQSVLESRLRDEGSLCLLNDMEMPLSRLLYDMEQRGFMLNTGELRRIGEDLRQQAETQRRVILEALGRDINLNSPQQLAAVLFDDLSMPVIKKTKTGRSTDSDVLEALSEQYPVAGDILAYRHLVKLIGTYIDGLQAAVSAGGRVHTRFHQALTATGRISSSEPNLQNIPVRTEQGRIIRRAFVAPPGCLLIDADYSQIELRVLAHMSGDPAFIDAFLSGQDIHRRTASEVYGVPMDIVTPAMRSAAKAVNFGIVYGISEFGLAQNTGISRREAAELISRFFARYPRVKAYMDEQVRMGYDEGYVATLMGRRRPMPELKSSNHQQRRFGERVAMNAPIQGSAADIIKLGMVRAAAALQREGLSARLILQVHDELILEAPVAEEAQAKALLVREMENVMTLAVPLSVAVSSGANWLEAHGG